MVLYGHVSFSFDGPQQPALLLQASPPMSTKMDHGLLAAAKKRWEMNGVIGVNGDGAWHPMQKQNQQQPHERRGTSESSISCSFSSRFLLITVFDDGSGTRCR